MGWTAGSELAECVWLSVRPFIAKKERQELAQIIITHFEDFDCDTLDEAEQLMEDAK